MLDLDAATSHYTIKVNGMNWFTSRNAADGGYAFTADGSNFSHSEGNLLTIGQPDTGNGMDEAGAFKFITISWSRNTSYTSTVVPTAEWITTFKV